MSHVFCFNSDTQLFPTPSTWHLGFLEPRIPETPPAARWPPPVITIIARAVFRVLFILKLYGWIVVWQSIVVEFENRYRCRDVVIEVIVNRSQSIVLKSGEPFMKCDMNTWSEYEVQSASTKANTDRIGLMNQIVYNSCNP